LGNKELKNALFRSAWIASCHHPAFKAQYKRTGHKEGNTTPLIFLARRRDVIYSMLNHGTYYEEKPAQAA
jgi:hypothetical protein